MSKSNYLESALLSWMKGTAFPAAPVTLYVALHTADPTDAGTGAEVSTTSTGYARASLTASTGWTAITDNAGAGRIATAVAVNFANPTASWGVVTHFSIRDALTAGNQLYHAALATPQTIGAGATNVGFASGVITVDEG